LFFEFKKHLRRSVGDAKFSLNFGRIAEQISPRDGELNMFDQEKTGIFLDFYKKLHLSVKLFRWNILNRFKLFIDGKFRRFDIIFSLQYGINLGS